jgi:hypothetical protein
MGIIDLDEFEEAPIIVSHLLPVEPESGMEILKYLLENGAKSRYELKTELKKTYSNIFDIVKKLLEQELIFISLVKASEKNPNIKVEYYGLTNEGLWKVLYETEKKDEEKKGALTRIFSIIQKNYPSFLPADLRELHASYFVSLYSTLERLGEFPFSLNLIKIFLRILKVKADEKRTETVIIKTDSMQNEVPITEKEVSILSRYVEKLLKENEKIVKAYMKEIEEEKTILHQL